MAAVHEPEVVLDLRPRLRASRESERRGELVSEAWMLGDVLREVATNLPRQRIGFLLRDVTELIWQRCPELREPAPAKKTALARRRSQ